MPTVAVAGNSETNTIFPFSRALSRLKLKKFKSIKMELSHFVDQYQRSASPDEHLDFIISIENSIGQKYLHISGHNYMISAMIYYAVIYEFKSARCERGDLYAGRYRWVSQLNPSEQYILDNI